MWLNNMVDPFCERDFDKLRALAKLLFLAPQMLKSMLQ